jgi:hypothetical protein
MRWMRGLEARNRRKAFNARWSTFEEIEQTHARIPQQAFQRSTTPHSPEAQDDKKSGL